MFFTRIIQNLLDFNVFNRILSQYGKFSADIEILQYKLHLHALKKKCYRSCFSEE